MEAIRIVIAEKDEKQRHELVEQLSQYPQLEVVGHTGCGNEAIHLVMENQPDILLTNIVLPQYDGLSVLDQIRMRGIAQMPKVIIISSLNVEGTILKAFSKGVDEYMIRPLNHDLLVRKIYELMGREEMMNQLSEKPKERESNNRQMLEADRERLLQSISSLFLRIGLPVHLLGFRFAQEAVFMLVENPELMKNRTKVLYPVIAEKHHTNAFSVERAIRHVITLTWERDIAAKFDREYGQAMRLHLPADKPTSGEFIALIAEYLRPRCRHLSIHHET